MGEGANGVWNREAKFFVDFVATNPTKVVALCIKETGLQKLLTTTHRRWFAGSKLFVELKQSLIFRTNTFIVSGINRLLIKLRMTELIQYIVIGKTHGTHEYMGIDLASFINSNVEKIVFICLKLQPCPTIGNHTGVVSTTTIFVHFIFEIDAWTTHDLVHDHAFSTINDKRAAFSHERQFAYKYLLLFNLTRLLINESAGDVHLRCKRRVAALGLFHIVARALKSIFTTDEVQLKLAGVVGNWREAF